MSLYTKTDLIDITKEEQIIILMNEIGLTEKEANMLKNEGARVKKILQLQKERKEQPLNLENKGEVCERCGAIMVVTGGGPSGRDYKCPKCLSCMTK